MAIPGIIVSISSENSEKVVETITDSSGRFELGSIENGTYLVKPLRPGFTIIPETKPVVVNNASVSAVDFQAEPHELQILAGVP